MRDHNFSHAARFQRLRQISRKISHWWLDSPESVAYNWRSRYFSSWKTPIHNAHDAEVGYVIVMTKALGTQLFSNSMQWLKAKPDKW